MHKLIKFCLIVVLLQGCITNKENLSKLASDTTIAFVKAEWRVNSKCQSFAFKINEKSDYPNIEQMAIDSFKQISNSHDYYEKGHPPYIEFSDSLKPKVVNYKSPYKQRKIILISYNDLTEPNDTNYLICNTYEKRPPDWKLLTVFKQGSKTKLRQFTLKEINELSTMKSEFNIVE